MVARQAHNLKVVGSNPTSATNFKTNSDIISCRKELNQIKMQAKTKTPKEKIIELCTGKSIEEIEENNRILQELITNKAKVASATLNEL